MAKALEKDKARRYTSAGDLASDIRRYLRGEAILARPASALYQIRKFARRHSALVVGAAGVFAALIVGTIVSIVFALHAAENARVADENARVADENARVAEARERVAIYQSYRARIAAAVAALSHHDVVDAAVQLDAAPELLRGWEWRYLRNRLDDSTSVIPSQGRSVPVPDPRSERQPDRDVYVRPAYAFTTWTVTNSSTLLPARNQFGFLPPTTDAARTEAHGQRAEERGPYPGSRTVSRRDYKTL